MSTVPNLPSLSANGATMKSSDKTFSKPYSAKTVFFYKEGDEFFQGVRVPVSKARYRTLDSLLDDLNDKVPLYFGVRRVFTPRGKREVHSIDELENQGRYVCASSKWTKGLTAAESYQQWKSRGFENERAVVPRRKRSLTRNTNGPIIAPNAHSILAVTDARKERTSRRLVSNSIAPRPLLHESSATKQVLFALNGMPNRVYRMNLKTRRLPQFEDVLQELSDMLHVPVAKLYTPDGNKVTSVADILSHGHMQLLACQRHERPTVAGKLPPLIISNSSPTKRSPRLARRAESKPVKVPPSNDLEPLPKITSSAAGISSAAEKKPDKRIRRRTISKRKRKKIAEPVIPHMTGNGDDPETHKAATLIQATFRGYRTRRTLQEREPVQYPGNAHRAATVIQAGVKGYLTRKKYRPRNGMSPVKTPSIVDGSKEIEARSNAATTIQTSFRGYAARKRLESRKSESDSKTAHHVIEENHGTRMKKNSQEVAVVNGGDGTSKESEPVRKGTELTRKGDEVAKKGNEATKKGNEVAKKGNEATRKGNGVVKKGSEATRKGNQVKKSSDGAVKEEKKKKQTGNCTYRISIYVGNRWAADCDGDLYVILHGEKGDTKKLVLKQSQQELRFQQNQMDSFDVEAAYVGQLKKITVGHENQGYGSGIYIDRIVVAELEIDSQQHLFPCAKWFDSGQVDGKVERVLPSAGYQKLNEKTKTAAVDGVELPLASRGRWTIRLRAGRAIPDSFKTQLYLTAYGTFGRSEMIPFPDQFKLAAEAEYSFNVEFGELGELFKLRFDVEQDAGHAWLLDWVEMKDVDTGEEMRMGSNKWFCQRSPDGVKVLHPQTFREVPVLKIGVEPLPTFQYALSVRTSTNLVGCGSPVSVQLSGEFGDSGSYKLPDLDTTKEVDINIVVESVSLGRLMFVSFSAPVSEKGAVYMESFRALQEIYDRHAVPASVAMDWIAHKAVVRESTHAPYQFIFGESRIVEPDSPDLIKKQLTLTDMEGLKTLVKPTKKKKDEPSKTNRPKKRDKSEGTETTPNGLWRIFVTTGEHADGGTDCTPYLIVYGEEGMTKPTPLLDKKQRFTPGSTCHFDVDLKGIGRVFKIRVRLDTSGPNPMWYLKRIKMKNLSSGDELRFPVEMWLEKSDDNPEVSVELPAVWPDVPPLPSVLYNVTLCTGTNSDNDTDFDVYLTIFGQKGDTGKRFLRSPVGTQRHSCLKPGNIDTFELEAVSVREISKVQVGVEPRKTTASWYLVRVEILDPESEQLYIFKCDKWFSDSKGDQKLERFLNPVSSLDDSS